MKMVYIGSDPRVREMLALAVRIGWPDARLLPVTTAEEGLELIDSESPDVVLVDADSLDMTLGEAIIGIRHFTSVPLLVTGRPGDVKEVVTALESGSDAYVRLPCNLTELMVRIRGLLRRTGGRLICPNEAPLASGPLTINPSTYEVFLEDHPISLTPSEFKLLYLLVSHRGAIVTGSAMEYSLWGDQVARSGSAKKYIRSLRRKLGANPTEPMWIANVPRVGYRFLGPGSVPATAMGLAA